MQNISLKECKTEILSGLTVALALVPEAVAFAFVAHVDPMIALYAACIVCFVTAVFGGRPGMISGATGALAVVMSSLVIQYGVQYLFATLLLMGVLQILAGVFRLGKFIHIIPYPVMLGFVNGLALVIFLAQLKQFQVLDPASGQFEWLQGQEMLVMLALAFVTMLVIHFIPKLTKAIPAPLAGISAVFALTHILGIDTKSVGDMASIAGSLPQFAFPVVPFTFETFKIIFPYALTLAGVGLIESLLTLSLVDEITGTKGQNSKECIAQGSANIVCGLFGAMGGCAMIGQSMINVSSGARKRLSGIAASVFLMFFILFGSALVERIPIAALTGLMFMVVIGTFAWSSLRIMHKIPRVDAFVIVLVSSVTVMYDLAVAVLIGVVFSALSFAWESAKHIWADSEYDEENDTKTYNLWGPLFFGSASNFKDLFSLSKDPSRVIVNFEKSRVWDHSALEAMKNIAAKYKKAGKIIKFKGLSEDCTELLRKKGILVISEDDSGLHYELV